MDARYLLGKLPYRNRTVLINSRQSVGDIVREVTEAHEWFKKDYDRIATDFSRPDLRDTFRVLFDFCKDNIRYREETERRQTAKSPAHIISDRIGDCKHYALFIAGVLHGLQRLGKNFKWAFRFASYDSGEKIPGHVFVVASVNGSEYWIDPVLNSFNNRYKPAHFIDRKPKVSGMALYRIGAIEDYPATDFGLLDADDRELSPELIRAVQILLYRGVMDTRGRVNDRRITYLHSVLPSDQFKAIANARIIVQRAAEVSGLFSGVVRAVKKVTFFAQRAAFLGLVRLNAFGFAPKLKAATWDKAGAYTDVKPKIKDTWQKKLGGDWAILESAIIKGSAKKAILGAVPAAVPAWLATAAAVIALIMPLVNAFLKRQQSSGIDTGYSELPTGLPTQGGGTGIMQWVQENPLPALAIGGGLVWFLTSK